MSEPRLSVETVYLWDQLLQHYRPEHRQQLRRLAAGACAVLNLSRTREHAEQRAEVLVGGRR
jgi:hypothetical protein